MQNNNDPADEDAERRRRFLEDGAAVRAEVIEQYPTVTPTLAVPTPLPVQLPDTIDVSERLERDDEVEAVITLEFPQVEHVPDLGLLVFVNTARAGADTPTSAPGFLGTINFFHDHGHQHPTTVRLPARRAIVGTAPPGPIEVTLVPVAVPGRRLPAEALDVRTHLELVRATVG